MHTMEEFEQKLNTLVSIGLKDHKIKFEMIKEYSLSGNLSLLWTPNYFKKLKQYFKNLNYAAITDFTMHLVSAFVNSGSGFQRFNDAVELMKFALDTPITKEKYNNSRTCGETIIGMYDLLKYNNYNNESDFQIAHIRIKPGLDH